MKNRSRVLKRLGHINADGVVQTKGRAACLIDTADELLVTELMFNGTFFVSHLLIVHFAALLSSWPNCIPFVRAGLFNDIDHHQVVAIASCFLPVEKSNEHVRLTNELAWPLEKLKETAKQLAEVCLS